MESLDVVIRFLDVCFDLRVEVDLRFVRVGLMFGLILGFILGWGVDEDEVRGDGVVMVEEGREEIGILRILVRVWGDCIVVFLVVKCFCCELWKIWVMFIIWLI